MAIKGGTFLCHVSGETLNGSAGAVTGNTLDSADSSHKGTSKHRYFCVLRHHFMSKCSGGFKEANNLELCQYTVYSHLHLCKAKGWHIKTFLQIPVKFLSSFFLKTHLNMI